jgi:hypothetical protein
MRFVCKDYPTLKLSTNAGPVQFVDGVYETENKVIIASLKSCPLPITMEKSQPAKALAKDAKALAEPGAGGDAMC